MNGAVLAMALVEYLELGDGAIPSIGLAALLIDGRLSSRALPARSGVRQPSGTCLRRVRRAPHPPALPGRVAAGADLDHMQTRAGTEFDPAIAQTLIRMMRACDNRVGVDAARDKQPVEGASR
jgi:hypothetical protein